MWQVWAGYINIQRGHQLLNRKELHTYVWLGRSHFMPLSKNDPPGREHRSMWTMKQHWGRQMISGPSIPDYGSQVQRQWSGSPRSTVWSPWSHSAPHSLSWYVHPCDSSDAPAVAMCICNFEGLLMAPRCCGIIYHPLQATVLMPIRSLHDTALHPTRPLPGTSGWWQLW